MKILALHIAPQVFAAAALCLGLAAAFAWYYDVYVNWQQKLYPLALAALGVGTVLLTLFTLHALGEHSPLALVWKTLLSTVVFMGVLNGVTAIAREALHLGVQKASVAAMAFCAVQVIVLYALLLHGQRGTLGRPGIALGAAVLAMSLAGAVLFMWNASRPREYLTRAGLPADQPQPGRTAIHFLYTGSSDAILLESGGHFALVDAGNTNEDTKRYVLDYVKQVAGGQLEFILATHAHSDHIGGFDTLILSPDITIGRAYLKPLMEHGHRYEKNKATHALYGQVTDALAQRGVPVIEDIPEEPFALGEFTVTLFGGGYNGKPPYDENDCSVGLLAQAFGQQAFLAGDMNNYGGRETRLAPRIGKVDLVKAPHHGGEGSSSKRFVNILRPRMVVSTGGGNWKVWRRYARAGAQLMLYTGDFGGIAAVFGENGIECRAIGGAP